MKTTKSFPFFSKKTQERKRKMNKKIGIIILAMLCATLALPIVYAETDLEINIHGEDPQVEVNAYSEGEGELVIIYNGENVLETIDAFDHANMIFMTTLNNERDVEKLVDIFEEQFYNFTVYVDHVTNTLYTRDNLLASNIGLTEVNNTLVLSIMDGDTTIVTEIEVLKYEVSTIADVIKKNNEAILTDIELLQAENRELKTQISYLETQNTIEVIKLNYQMNALVNRMEESEKSFEVFDFITSLVVMIASIPIFIITKSRL